MKQIQPNISDTSDINIYPTKENVLGMVKVLIQVLIRIQSTPEEIPKGRLEKIKTAILNLLLNTNDPFTIYVLLLQLIIKDASGKVISNNKDLNSKLSLTNPCLKLKTVAESLLSIEEDNSKDNIFYWINWFTERKNNVELKILRQIICTNNLIPKP